MCAASSGHDGEEDVADDCGRDDGGHEEAAAADAARPLEEPSGGGAADDGADGEGRFVDGHAQCAVGAAGDAVEHAVRIGMGAEDAGHGDEHRDGDGV